MAPSVAQPHATALLTVRVAGLLLSATTLIAGATWLLAAAPTRRWLQFPFRGVPARAGEAVAIFTHNGRVLAGVFGLLLIAQLALRNPDAHCRLQRTLRKLGEALLAGLVAINVLWVGASVGAYGIRMVRAMLPARACRARRLRAHARSLPPRPPPHPADTRARDDRRRQRPAARRRRRARNVHHRMRPLRSLMILVVIGGGLAASLVLVPRAIRSLHSSPLPRATPTKPYPAGRDPDHTARVVTVTRRPRTPPPSRRQRASNPAPGLGSCTTGRSSSPRSSSRAVSP